MSLSAGALVRTPSPAYPAPMSLNDYVLRWLKRKDISTETFSEADYVVKDKSIVCKFKLSASRTCNHKVTVGTDQAGRWKI